MDQPLIEMIANELHSELTGLEFRKVFQLGLNDLAIAFDGSEFRLLFISVDPSEPRIYLIKRRLKELKKESTNPSKFANDLAKELRALRVTGIECIRNERVVEVRFGIRLLIVQLTGRSANTFLLDEKRQIISAFRRPGNDGQFTGKTYLPPDRAAIKRNYATERPLVGELDSGRQISEILDEYFQGLGRTNMFVDLAAKARNRAGKKVKKLKTLVRNLESDLKGHGSPEKWKRYGDLLLANGSSASRQGDVVLLKDLFEENAPIIAIEVKASDSIAQAAQCYFGKYSKARNASNEIARRLKVVTRELTSEQQSEKAIEKAIEDKDVEFLQAIVGDTKVQRDPVNRPGRPRLPAGIRSFISTDGFEILIGKKAADNDMLTFRIANSRDTWMHAADFPGSHVVIRNPDRKDIPQKTLAEAAALAGFYSQGKKQPKAAVNYTQKKFVSKPKGSASGLVRLSSFKTILIEPHFPSSLQPK